MGIEIMDEHRKKRMLWLSLLPCLAFLLAGAYHLLIFKDEMAHQNMEDHIALATETSRHFTSLTIAYGIASFLSLLVLLYFISHLARLKILPAGSKIFWAFLMAILAPVSLPIFWYVHIRKEPRKLEMYPEV